MLHKRMLNMNSSNTSLQTRNVCLLFTILLCCQSFSSAATTYSRSNKRPASPIDNLSKKQVSRPKIMERAFANAGQVAGIEIWRIEDFKPVAYPKSDYGKFYTGDSYIVLSTRVNKYGDKAWDLHYWLGTQTTQDEAGSAAIFTVQLDEGLGGEPVQYREVQEHESQLFLSYFKSGVRYLPGGISSGFTHVDPNAFVTRLYQVKGARNIRVKEVGASIASMNKGDCFILDAGRDIYVYVGQKSKRVERLKAIAAANQIRDQDHAGKAKVQIVDEYSPEKDFEDFFKALGSGSKAAVPDESTGGDDQQFESNQEKIVSLYRVSDASGQLKVELVAQKPLQQSNLDPNDCFILDTTDSNLFAWIGKKCNAKEKSEALNKAEAYLKSKNYPGWTHVQRIVEGTEPAAFTQYFQNWKGTGEIRSRLLRSVSSEENNSWEPRLFHAEIRSKGDKFKVEEIFDFQQKDLDEDDVMILDIGKQIFVWIGKDASVEERTKATDLGKEYLKKHQRDSVPIITVNQREEPESFTSFFFPSWDSKLWDTVSTYNELKNRILEGNLLHI